MTTYHVPPLPRRAQVLRAIGEACLALTVEFAISPRRWGVHDYIGQAVIGTFLLFFFQQEGPFDLEVDLSGIRKIKRGQVERAVSSERIRYARESGYGPFRALVVSEHPLAWLGLGRLIVPARLPEYEQIKAQVLSWIEHPRGNPASLSLR